jgi:hypothetical protein
MASRRRVRVHPAAIRSLWIPGGGVHRYTGRFRRSLEYQVRIAAPKRTGTLRRSIGSDRRGTNQFGNRVTVWVAARHAKWVLLGTNGKTMPPGRAMKLYAKPRPVAAARGRRDWTATIGRLTRSVDGQVANNFLDDGLDRALTIHRLR